MLLISCGFTIDKSALREADAAPLWIRAHGSGIKNLVVDYWRPIFCLWSPFRAGDLVLNYGEISDISSHRVER